MKHDTVSHWQSVAQAWKYFAPPLRPCAEDIELFEQVASDLAAQRGDGLSVQLCGVTPEIAAMRWPAGTSLSALELSDEMIREVWPGDIPGQRVATQGSWLTLDSSRGERDLVIGDGCFISMGFPHGYRDLAARLASILKPGGLFVMRFFIRPEVKESCDKVIADLAAGRIGSFHIFKWRLAMALQNSSEEGVCLHDIYTTWENAAIDLTPLLGREGWEPEAIRTLSLYEGKQNRFAFATLEEVERILSESFYLESIRFPLYELGERCPMIVCKPL